MAQLKDSQYKPKQIFTNLHLVKNKKNKNKMPTRTIFDYNLKPLILLVLIV